MYRGSRKHLLDWVEHPRFIPELLALAAPASVKVTADSVWAPEGYRFPDEARLENWGPQHWGASEKWSELEQWWLAAPRGANTPNWDFAMVAEIEGQKGLLLVEAKANVPELSRAGKEPPGESVGSQANHQRIGEAIESARVSLSALAPDLKISRDNYYQLSNRLAFTWKLASLGIPVVLMYLGFTEDHGIRDAGEPLADSEHWLRQMRGHLDAVGARDLTERRHELAAAPFWVLARSRRVLQPSEPANRLVGGAAASGPAPDLERQVAIARPVTNVNSRPASDVKAATRKVLGIDVASAGWTSNGSATIEFDDSKQVFTRVVAGAISWPTAKLTPKALADAIDDFARREEVCAVSLDGPQGWRDPATAPGTPGVGRRCEYECQTQGKTGTYPRTYPGNQRAWIEFSIDVFAHLLAKPGVTLANSETVEPLGVYVVLECFPTSAWRTSGLIPLPGKGKRPALAPYLGALVAEYALPLSPVTTHDDLQAVVAALTAVGAVGGPACPVPRGTRSTIVSDQAGPRRVEGFIWNVKPLRRGTPTHPDMAPQRTFPSTAPTATSVAAAYVTQGVVDQVNRAGATQMQIALSDVPGGTRDDRIKISLTVGDDDYLLIVGDSHAAWRSHQDSETQDSFEKLFAILADKPGQRISISKVTSLA